VKLPPPAATLLDRLAWRAATTPAGEAFVFADRSCSYAELWRGIEAFAFYLRQIEIEPGARVVIALPNGVEFFTAFYGVQRAGAIAVPVFPGSGAERLLGIARRSAASAVVTATPAVVDAVSTDRAPEQLALQVIPPNPPVATAPRRALPAVDPQAVAYIQYTSGSTGEPKGVQITHANALINVEQMIAGMAITRREVFVSWLPVHHDMGLVLMTMTPFYLGARLILLPASLRDARSWLAALAEHRGTFTAAPDFAYRLALRQVREPANYDLSSLRVALNAAEPVRTRTLVDFQQAFALEQVMVPGYGLAEATVGVSMSPPGVAPKIDASGFPSVGRGFPGVELAILGDSGLLGADETGEILVRSPANTPGYWDDPEATAALFWDEGYLRTGDLGYLDQDGDLFVVGRRKNVIIQAGRNIAPGEVEAVIDALPFVRLSAAVGIDRGGIEGEQVYAFVELRGRKSLPREDYRQMAIEVSRRVRSELGLGPGRVYLMPARGVPRTHNGKLRHAELKRRYLEGALGDEGLLLFPEY